MSTFVAAERRVEGDERRIVTAPAEGWTTLGLVALLSLTFAWSLDDAAWVLGRPGLTSFLPWAVLLGVGWGFLSAKAGWSRWLAHLLGAIFGVLIVGVIVGSVLVGEGWTPGTAFVATADSTVEAWFDLTRRGLAFTQQVGHFMLVLGLLGWATGQFAGYATFGHRRPLGATVLVGAALLVNMALTRHDQFAFLVVYSLAALILLIRMHAVEERATWLRHRIGDSGALAGLYLRGGTVFVGAAVIASLALSSSVSAAPLSGVWRGLDHRFADLGRQLERIFRSGGSGRLNVVDFGSSATITGAWQTDSTPILQIRVPDAGHYYWRAVAYDQFDGRTWSWSAPSASDVGGGTPVLGGSADDPTGLQARHPLTFSVTELDQSPDAIFAPDVPLSVSTPSRIELTGTGANGFFAGWTSDATSYDVTASVFIDGEIDPANGITANKLKVAGTDYRAALTARYLQVDPRAIGPATKQLLEAIRAKHPDARTPYEIARATTDYLLREGGFRYEADVRGQDCGGAGVVECFARYKAGYCEHFASTMAILLRMQGIPSRLAEGFLPGPQAADGTQLIRKSSAHAWVEVFFPGYGWYPFDPTGGGVGRDRPPVEGPVVEPLPSASPTRSFGPDETDPRRTFRPPGSGGATGGGSTGAAGGPGSAALAVVAVLLALGVGGLAFIAWQRGPRGPVEPDRVYRGVVGVARRFGFGPRPNQTVYEYTDALGDLLPEARPNLSVVARAKVEVAYGKRALGPERLGALRLAQRQLRVALFGLLFRRRHGWSIRRRTRP